MDFADDIAPMIGKSADEFRGLIRPGHIVGSVVVAGAYSPEDQAGMTDAESAWYDGEWGWRLTDARLYVPSIGPISGRLNLWDSNVVAGLAEQLTTAERNATPMPFLPPLVIPEAPETDPDVLISYWDAEEKTDYTAKELRLLVEKGKMSAEKAARIRASGVKTDDELLRIYDAIDAIEDPD